MMCDTQHLRLVVETADGTTVARFTSDRVFLDEEAVHFLSEQFLGLADGSVQDSLALDFGSVEYLSSLMLGTLLRLRRKLHDAGRRLTLVNLRPEVYEVFEVTRLTVLLDVYRGGRQAVTGPASRSG
jgi:anti-sigma B factor antagonist